MDGDLELIIEFIRDELAYDGEINRTADLLEEKILDSFSIVQVALFLQDQFEIELEEEDLQRENLATLDSMLALVASRRSA